MFGINPQPGQTVEFTCAKGKLRRGTVEKVQPNRDGKDVITVKTDEGYRSFHRDGIQGEPVILG
jgi:hypothetical protein